MMTLELLLHEVCVQKVYFSMLFLSSRWDAGSVWDQKVFPECPQAAAIWWGQAVLHCSWGRGLGLRSCTAQWRVSDCTWHLLTLCIKVEVAARSNDVCVFLLAAEKPRSLSPEAETVSGVATRKFATSNILTTPSWWRCCAVLPKSTLEFWVRQMWWGIVAQYMLWRKIYCWNKWCLVSLLLCCIL